MPAWGAGGRRVIVPSSAVLVKDWRSLCRQGLQSTIVSLHAYGTEALCCSDPQHEG